MSIEEQLRGLAPRVLGTLVRRYGRFDACEDAVQEAILDAALQWPRDGVPANPRGWLLTAAHRRLIDELRSESARRRREEGLAREPPPGEAADEDDTLELLFMCCHESLTPASQVALTLRAVGGLTTAEIASAFLVPESTMAQRISRAKATIRAAGARFAPPAPEALPVVLHVLYLIFNEGYMASSGAHVARVELSAEAIRLTREVHRRLPDDGEVAGLLALMLLTDARRPARARADGSLVPLAEQDRSLWDRAKIAEGVALVEESLASKPGGPYQLQAAIAAIHDEAPSARETDWRQILAVYEAPRARLARADGHAQPSRRGRDGPRSARGTGVAGDARRAAARPPPSGGRARPSPRNGRRRGRRPRGVRARRSPHHEHSGATLSRGANGCSVAVRIRRQSEVTPPTEGRGEKG